MRLTNAADQDLAEWDAEIEAAFQLEVAATQRPAQLKRGRRLVAFPLAFSADVCRRTEGRTALVVAQLIYRRTHVCGSQTVTLLASELAEHGITRQRKAEALAKLEAAGLLRIEKVAPGRAAEVTLTWRPS
jgi:hypothetical protein